jgi:hypothetical protein
MNRNWRATRQGTRWLLRSRAHTMALTCKNLVEPETRIELVTYALRVRRSAD